MKDEREKAAIDGEEKVEADIIIEDDSLPEDGAPKREAEEEDNVSWHGFVKFMAGFPSVLASFSSGVDLRVAF